MVQDDVGRVQDDVGRVQDDEWGLRKTACAINPVKNKLQILLKL
jgi:hypothetical protein